MGIEKCKEFCAGFNDGFYARLSLEDAKTLSLYHFQYPEGIKKLEKAFEEASKKHLDEMVRESEGNELFRSDLHDLTANYGKITEFAARRDYLCGFFSAVIVKNNTK